MRIMTINTGRMSIFIQYHTLVRSVLVVSFREGMPNLGKLGKDIGNRRRDVGATIMASDTVLGRLVHIRDRLRRSIE